jgi:hypothetical protein
VFVLHNAIKDILPIATEFVNVINYNLI